MQNHIKRLIIFAVVCSVLTCAPVLPQDQEEEPEPTPAAVTAQSLNPDISVIGDFAWRDDTRFSFREAELGLQAVVDPYARADFFMAFPGPGEGETPELEEGYLTILRMPYDLQAKLGFFRLKFGKLNLTHPPENRFADLEPNVVVNFLGDEGLADTGIELSALLPNPFGLYTELSAGLFNGDNEASFHGGTSRKPVSLLHLKNFIDLTDATSMEFGASYAQGVNDAEGNLKTKLTGLDFQVKWRHPVFSQYNSRILQGEWLQSRRDVEDGSKAGRDGFFVFFQEQIERRAFLGLRYDESEFPLAPVREKAGSIIASFYPSEFSLYRLQYKHTREADGTKSNLWLFQTTFTLGPHRPHAF